MPRKWKDRAIRSFLFITSDSDRYETVFGGRVERRPISDAIALNRARRIYLLVHEAVRAISGLAEVIVL